MKKEFILILQFTTFIEPKKYNFQNPLITASAEKRKFFDCNIVNSNLVIFLMMKAHRLGAR